MTAELAARRTAAGAVLADFKAATDAFVRGEADPPAYVDWAFRLSSELHSMLDGTEPTGGAHLTQADLATVLDALDVAADYKRDRAANCPECDASPADLCSTCEWRLHIADGYDALARRIGGAS